MTETLIIVSPAQGPRGPKGDVGDDGPTGPRGFTGDQGLVGVTGAGYNATSVTSLVISNSASRSFVIGSGFAYTLGARIRATSRSNGSYMEGVVTSYDGTNLVATMALSSGSGTFTDWNINVAGDTGTTTVTGAGTLGVQNSGTVSITGGTIAGVTHTGGTHTGLPTPTSSGDAATKGYMDGRNVATSGLASGGGNLSADRTIAVPIASQAQAEAGVDNATAVTPLRAAQAIAALGSGNPFGTVVFTIRSSAPAGWLLFNDSTLGDASSSASHANADSVNVFTELYNNVSDANCPLLTSGGGATTRGAQGTAAAAFAAHCRMTLPKSLGRALAVAGSGATLTTRALGLIFGEEGHQLTSGENGPHVHPLPDGSVGPIMGPISPETVFLSQSNGTPNSSNTSSSGSGTAHNTMQPTLFLNAMVKL